MNSLGVVSKAATLRGMAVANGSAVLSEIKAVDERYPLYGTLALDGGKPLSEALAFERTAASGWSPMRCSSAALA